MTYIYLNTYFNGYLYVGSHTWSGEGIDPNYHGSSKVANLYNWKPLKIEILRIVKDGDLREEGRVIKEYCLKYGIADCAARLSHSQEWLNKFPKHGKMLNLHSNDISHALAAAHSQEAIEKQQRTRRELGVNITFAHAGNRSAQKKESRLRAVATVNSNIELKQRMLSGIRTKEALVHSAESKKRNDSYNKGIRKRLDSGVFLVRRYVNVYKDGVQVCKGSVGGCCKKLGNVNWSCLVNREFKNGVTEVTHHGYRFVLISHE